MVDLIAVTPNAEQLIVDCARVSNPANHGKDGTALIRYLVEHGHWSPFEMANMVVSVKTSRAISAQITRHRSFTFQEFSQRYAAVRYADLYQARRQDRTNRQDSIDDLPKEDRDWFLEAQRTVHETSRDLYLEALSRGIAKECARFLLPMSAETHLYVNGTVRSWIHYLDLRCGNGAQKEHAELAQKIKHLFASQFPITYGAVWPNVSENGAETHSH